jgi:hypothetical protein
MRAHETYVVHLLRTGSTERNPITIDPLPSVEDIAKVIEGSSQEDAILIAKTEILSLDELSLEGDVPDDLSITDR